MSVSWKQITYGATRPAPFLETGVGRFMQHGKFLNAIIQRERTVAGAASEREMNLISYRVNEPCRLH